MTQEITLITKDPDAIEPQGLDWTDHLATFATPELIVASAWEITYVGPFDEDRNPISDDPALSFANDSIVVGNLQTQAVFSGGALGARYKATNRITTTSGYKADQSLPFLIEQG